MEQAFGIAECRTSPQIAAGLVRGPGGPRLARGARIAVLMGGETSEREVSLESGRQAAEALRASGMDVLEIDISGGYAGAIARFRPKVAFLALHGGFGEDGGIQRELESAGVRYTGSRPMASLLCMDKELTKRALERAGVPSPRFACLSVGASCAEIEGAISDLGFPLVVKPTSEGSSKGVSVAKSRLEIERGLARAFELCGRAMLEEHIAGRELNVAILDGLPLPLVEVKAQGGFFSYEAKYGDSGTKYVVNPKLGAEERAAVLKAALDAYEEVGCRHYARIEIILSNEGKVPYLIEINTLPGMTSHSLFPMAAKAAGITLEELCLRIAEMALD